MVVLTMRDNIDVTDVNVVMDRMLHAAAVVFIDEKKKES
jgi:hypothetical protein